MLERKDIAARLKTVRALLGLSQKALAEKIGIEEHRVRNIENTRSNLTFDIAKKINEIFSVNISWLLEGRGEMFENQFGNQLIGSNIAGVAQSIGSGTHTIHNITVNSNNKGENDEDLEKMFEELKKIVKNDPEVLILLQYIADGFYTKNHIKVFIEKLEQVKKTIPL